jgi:hypothetical protein
MYIRRRKIKVITTSLKAGNTRYNACKAAGITTMTLWYWCRKSARLQNLINLIIDDRIRIVEDALYQSAVGGNQTAQIFFLMNRAPERWADKRALVNNYNVIKNTVNPLGKLADEDLDGIIAGFNKRIIA